MPPRGQAADDLPARVNLLGPWLKARFGGPVVKIPLDAGLSCPNRDGSVGRGGCAYCPPSGSGSGRGGEPLAGQIARGLRRLNRRKRPPKALAYYQAYSSTHCSPRRLEEILVPALAAPVDGVIVATRPDCLDRARMDVLAQAAEVMPLWLELGLQSAHDDTLAAINRGHGTAAFDRAVAMAQGYGIKVVAHVILGLPGEDGGRTNATARHLAGLGVWGVKLHNLMVLAGAPLVRPWRGGDFQPWSRGQWSRAAADFLARLGPDMVIHRLAADPGREVLLAPSWAGDKQAALAALAGEMRRRNLRQGDLCPRS